MTTLVVAGPGCGRLSFMARHPEWLDTHNILAGMFPDWYNTADNKWLDLPPYEEAKRTVAILQTIDEAYSKGQSVLTDVRSGELPQMMAKHCGWPPIPYTVWRNHPVDIRVRLRLEGIQISHDRAEKIWHEGRVITRYAKVIYWLSDTEELTTFGFDPTDPNR